ncbi:hypothetical protein niasHT_007659 [Heterodera trifolii]|uniref:Uncharacterized protein n=1 Tax=Heterodera trifolii TaxID=157864 RepID=A0ABD2LPT8_9BILA
MRQLKQMGAFVGYGNELPEGTTQMPADESVRRISKFWDVFARFHYHHHTSSSISICYIISILQSSSSSYSSNLSVVPRGDSPTPSLMEGMEKERPRDQRMMGKHTQKYIEKALGQLRRFGQRKGTELANGRGKSQRKSIGAVGLICGDDQQHLFPSSQQMRR